VDEASQLRMGELALAMAALKPGGRLVLAGDDLQLPPIVHGTYPQARDGLPGLHDSVFAYLRARDRGPGGADHYTCQLLDCWRMNGPLCRFAAETLYGDGFRPATPEIASRRLPLEPRSARSKKNPAPAWLDLLLDPEHPLVVAVLRGVLATSENKLEAELTARVAVELRQRLLGPEGRPYPATVEGDRQFWRRGLFIVSPHHVQIRAIERALAARRTWHGPCFVDTVDKMQGQQADAVLVSYGVSDPETALAEGEFIYSLERLNVAVTRARSHCVVFLPRPLLEPPFELLWDEAAARGLAHMHALLRYALRSGPALEVPLEGLDAPQAASLSVYRAGWGKGRAD
ncbi:MAG: ATP-dependent helicase, partial [Deltaproteobacteria bacterium]|nr:ATP-dependent helicase [Deltaproteobacteria bacterium]